MYCKHFVDVDFHVSRGFCIDKNGDVTIFSQARVQKPWLIAVYLGLCYPCYIGTIFDKPLQESWNEPSSMKVSISYMGVNPKIVGTPPNHPILIGFGFPLFSPSIFGYPYFWFNTQLQLNARRFVVNPAAFRRWQR